MILALMLFHLRLPDSENYESQSQELMGIGEGARSLWHVENFSVLNRGVHYWKHLRSYESDDGDCERINVMIEVLCD